MCRIMITSKLRNYQDNLFLVKYMNELVEEQGGHGNGISYLKNGEMVVSKGMLKTPIDLLSDVESDTLFTFHTRYASQGLMVDSNCQPFLLNTLNASFCHNGNVNLIDASLTLLMLKAITQREYDVMSDSYTLAKIIDVVGGHSFLKKLMMGDIFVVHTVEGAYIYCGKVFYWGDLGGWYLYASSIHMEEYFKKVGWFSPGSIVLATEKGFKMIEGTSNEGSSFQAMYNSIYGSPKDKSAYLIDDDYYDEEDYYQERFLNSLQKEDKKGNKDSKKKDDNHKKKGGL